MLLLIAGNLTSAILIWAHIYAQDIGNGLWSAYGLLGLATVAAAWFALRLVVAVLAVFYVPLAVVPLIIQGLVVLWAFVDARPAMAMAICIACTCVVYQTLSTISYGWAVVSPGPGLFIFVAAAVVLACGSFWLLRRRAVL